MISWSIYRILFPNGKSYIGLTKSIEHRKAEHNYRAFTQKVNTPIYSAFRKHGKDSVVWEILESNIPNLETANNKEAHYIIVYDTFHKYKKGYNCTTGGDGTKSLNHSTDCRKRIGESSKARWATIEYREKHKLAMKTAKPKVYREDSRSGEHLKNPETHPWTGRHHTEATIELKQKNTPGKKVLNETTGVVYNSLQEAGRCNPEIHVDTIRNICNNRHNKPSTKLRFKFIE